LAALLILVTLTIWYIFFGPYIARTAGQADALDLAGKYGAAESKLDSVMSLAVRRSDKELILSRLAGTNDDMGNKTLALQYYLELNQLEPNNLSTVTSIAEDADQLGDNATAVAAYHQAISLLSKDKSAMGGADEIAQMTQRISELQQ
jgi:tetratricopeptide (TPR) repeat protein